VAKLLSDDEVFGSGKLLSDDEVFGQQETPYEGPPIEDPIERRARAGVVDQRTAISAEESPLPERAAMAVRRAGVAPAAAAGRLVEGFGRQAEAGRQFLKSIPNTLEMKSAVDRLSRKADEIRQIDSGGSVTAFSPEAAKKRTDDLRAQILQDEQTVNDLLAVYHQYKRERDKAGEGATSFDEVLSGRGDFWTWAGESLGQGVVSMAPILAAAAVPVVGGPLALGAGIALNTADIQQQRQDQRIDERYFGSAGVARPSAIEQGMQEGQQVIEQIDRESGVTGAVVAGYTLLDVALGPAGKAIKGGFIRMFGKEGAEAAEKEAAEQLAKLTKSQAVKAVLKEVGAQTFEEALNEGGQEFLSVLMEKALDDKDVFTYDTAKRLMNAAAAGGLTGGVVGGAGRAGQIGVAKAKAAKAGEPGTAPADFKALEDAPDGGKVTPSGRVISKEDWDNASERVRAAWMQAAEEQQAKPDLTPDEEIVAAPAPTEEPGGEAGAVESIEAAPAPVEEPERVVALREEMAKVTSPEARKIIGEEIVAELKLAKDAAKADELEAAAEQVADPAVKEKLRKQAAMLRPKAHKGGVKVEELGTIDEAFAAREEKPSTKGVKVEEGAEEIEAAPVDEQAAIDEAARRDLEEREPSAPKKAEPKKETKIPDEATLSSSKLLRRIKREGGLPKELASDLGLDPKELKRFSLFRREERSESGPLFVKGGRVREDNLIMIAQDMGLMTEAEAQSDDAQEMAFEIVRNELRNPGSAKPVAQREADMIAKAERKERDAMLDQMREDAEAFGIDLTGLTDQQVAARMRDAYAGLDAKDVQDLDAAVIARLAADIDPDAVERAAIASEGDLEAFLREAQRIIDGHETSQARPSESLALGGKGTQPAPGGRSQGGAPARAQPAAQQAEAGRGTQVRDQQGARPAERGADTGRRPAAEQPGAERGGAAGRVSVAKVADGTYVAKIGGAEVGRLNLDDSNEYPVSVRVEPEHRRKGVATALYDFAENDLGKKLKRSPTRVTQDGDAFLRAREARKAGPGVSLSVGGGRDQTKTPEFKRWFKDSKVVDADGKPLVVYHGTTADFGVFDKARRGEKTQAEDARGGFFFADNPRIANEFTWANGGREGGNIMPVYLRMTNPFRTDFPLNGTTGTAAGDVLKRAKAAGHDGVIFTKTDMLGSTGQSFVVFESEQIKSATGNRGTFDPASPDITMSVGGPNAIGLYSALERAIDQQIKAKSMPKGDWLNTLKSLPAKGVKPDEIEWSGIREWLELQGPRVEKQAVLDYLNANGVKVEEVTLGATPPPTEEGLAKRKAVFDSYAPRINPLHERAGDFRITPEERQAARDEAERLMDQRDREADAAYSLPADKALDPKFSTYTVPGGTNYREVLLTLPARDRKAILSEQMQAINERMAGTDGDVYRSLWEERQRLYEEWQSLDSTQFRSSHWDQPNVLAHIRLNDRVDADGKRVLFVEEIQSDWAQKGRKEGFADNARIAPKPDHKWTEQQAADLGVPQDAPAWAAYNAMGQEIGVFTSERFARLAVEQAKGGLPRAPFVDTTDKWVTLALKRILRMAAEGGYDKVAFINGTQAADLFDLSKQVQEINWDTLQPDTDAEIRRVYTRTNDDQVIKFNVRVNTGKVLSGANEFVGKPLDEVVGKEIAKHILETPDDALRGTGLQVGGEGMRAFYDKIVPAAANKLLAKVGGGKVETAQIVDAENSGRFKVWLPDVEDFHNRDFRFATDAQNFARQIGGEVRAVGEKTLTQPAITITPAMRDKVMAGLPLFKVGERSAGETKAAPRRVPPPVANTLKEVADGLTKRFEEPVTFVAVDKSDKALGDLQVRQNEIAANFVEQLFDKLTYWYEQTSGPAINGFSSTRMPRAIFMSVNGKHPTLAVTGHEFLHMLRKTAPEVFNDFADAMWPIVKAKFPQWKAEIQDRYKRTGSKETIGDDLAYEELMADVFGDRWTEPEFWRELSAQTGNRWQRVAERFLRFLDDAIGKVLSVRPFGTEQYISDLQKAREVVAKAMVDYRRVVEREREAQGIEAGLDQRIANLSVANLGPKASKRTAFDVEAYRANLARWISGSKVINDDGSPKVVYHGAGRPDRIGNRFKRTRATSGPMPFFTDSADIASGYATGKQDTSLTGDELHYSEWFQYKPKGARSAQSIVSMWWELSADQRARFNEAMRSEVYANDDGDIVTGDRGLAAGDTFDMYLRENRGNGLAAAIDLWLTSGMLFNEEHKFIQVLKLGGIDTRGIDYIEQNSTTPAVLAVYLKIRNPLDTRDIPRGVVDALEQKSRRQRAPRQQMGADMWDKNTRDPKQWMQALRDDLAEGKNSYAWTSIPDWVTETLESLGYDGIFDRGGKGGGQEHTVYIPFRPDQVKSAVGNRGTFRSDTDDITLSIGGPPSQALRRSPSNPQGGFWNTPDPLWRRMLDYLNRGFADNLERLARVQKALGPAIRDEINTYAKETGMHGRQTERLVDIKRRFMDPIHKIAALHKLSQQDVSDYLYALHAPEANAHIAQINPNLPTGGSGLTDAEARSIIAGFNAEQKKALDKIAALVRSMNDEKLERMVAEGLITRDYKNELQAKFPNWVSLKNFEDDSILGASKVAGMSGGMEIKGKEFKARTGRVSRAEDPLTMTVRDAMLAVIRAEKNRVARSFVQMVRENPNPDLWEMVTEANYPTRKEVGADGTVREVKDAGALFREPQFFGAKIDGEQVFVRIKDELLAEQMHKLGESGFGKGVIGDIGRAINTATRTMSMLYTQLSPDFMLVNPIRDVQQSIVVATSFDKQKGNRLAMRLAKSLPAALAASMRYQWAKLIDGTATGPDAALFEQFRMDGGTTGGFGLMDAEQIQRELQRQIDAASGKPAAMVIKATTTLFEPVMALNDAFENMSRFAVYKAALEEGFTRQQATVMAKNVTVNFNKRGTASPVFNALYAFFNASIQGNLVVARAIAKSRTAQAAALGLFLLGIMQEIAGDDEDETGTDPKDYVSEFKRDRSFVMPIGDGKAITVPLAYGLNIPFAMGRHAVRAMTGKESPGHAVAKLLELTFTTYLPTQTWTPTPIQPLVAAAQNKDFADRQIAKENPFDQVTPKSEQYRENANKVAVEVAKALNAMTGGSEFEKGAIDIAPEKISYVVKQYMGGIAAPIEIMSVPFKETVKARDIPVYRRFVNERSDSFYVGKSREIENENRLQRRIIENTDAEGSDAKLDYLEESREAERDLARLYRDRNQAKKAGNKEEVKAIDAEIDRAAREIVTLRNRAKSAEVID